MDVFPLTAMPQKNLRAHPAPRGEATEFFDLVSQLERHGKAVGSAASDESVEAEAAASGDPVPPEEVSSQGTDSVRLAHGQPLVVARGEFGEALSFAASKPEGATSGQVTKPLATSRHEQLVPSGGASTPHVMRLGQATAGLEPTPAAGSPAALANGAGGGLAHTADVASLTAPTAMKVHSHSSTSVSVDHVPNAVKSSLELSQIATRQPEMSKVEVSSPDSPPVDPTLEGVVDGGGQTIGASLAQSQNLAAMLPVVEAHSMGVGRHPPIGSESSPLAVTAQVQPASLRAEREQATADVIAKHGSSAWSGREVPPEEGESSVQRLTSTVLARVGSDGRQIASVHLVGTRPPSDTSLGSRGLSLTSELVDETSNRWGDIRDTSATPRPQGAADITALSATLSEIRAPVKLGPIAVTALDSGGFLQGEDIGLPTTEGVATTYPLSSRAHIPLMPVTSSSGQTPLVQQLAIAIREGTGGSIELQMQPEELGKLRIVMRPEGDAMRVHLVAERGETLELLRRNIGELSAELRDAGYETSSFTFAEQSSQDEEEESARHTDGYRTVVLATHEDGSLQNRPSAIRLLDMRL